MGQKITRPAVPVLEKLRRRFEGWRQSGRKGRKIPEEMWREAAELASEHGVNRVARSLGLDYNGVKQRMDEGLGGAKLLPTVRGPNFIELSVDTVARIPECVMEFQGRQGKLTIRLTEPGATDVVLLAKALTSGGR